MTTFVVDLSEWQDGLPLRLLEPAGVGGCVIRIHNGWRPDRIVASQLADMAANPALVCAGYVYVLAGTQRPIADQAAETIATLDAAGARWLPIALDCEEPTGIPHTDVLEYKRLLEAAGVRVWGMYSTQSWWSTDPAVPGCAAWIAHYPSTAPMLLADAYRQAGGDSGVGWSETLGGAPATLWQFTSSAVITGWSAGIDASAFKGTLAQLHAVFYGDTTPTAVTPPAATVVLDYPRDQVRQDTGWWCGPASTQTVIRGAGGPLIPESELAGEMGTTVDGTSSVYAVAPVLAKHLPAGRWRVVDTPTVDATGDMWEHITGSIDEGFGCVVNIVAPPSNYPRGVYGSSSPHYGGGTVYHYIAVMGYRDGAEGPAVWIADSGFTPYGYWLSFEQLKTLITPKGYVYAMSTTAERLDALENQIADIRRDTTLILDQLVGPARDEHGLPTWTGWESTGGRTVTDTIGALARRIEATATSLKGTK